MKKISKNFNSIKMMEWAKTLFPINRSITGKGVRQTIRFSKQINNLFVSKKIKTGKKVYDWKIPFEWKISKAYIKEVGGKKICDFNNNNLHVVGYSQNVNKILTFQELKKNIHFIREKPNAIPYHTSYYQKKWGFCLTFNQFKKLDKRKKYEVKIKSSFVKGNLDYAELLLKGKSKKEILITSYICHPSMANNELSGPLVVLALSKILIPRKYSIRLLLIPETIGAIAYIHKNLKNLKKNLIAGFNLTCVGDSGPFSLISSKEENTYADKIVNRILSKYKKTKKFSFLKRGSNERQFGCQNLNLPFVTICRTKFGEFKEYHTSTDNLSFVSEKNLKASLNFVLLIIKEIEKNSIYEKTITCEPFFSKYNLARSLRSNYTKFEQQLSDLSAYLDKNNDLFEISKKLGVNKKILIKPLNILKNKKIIKEFI